MAYPVSAPHIVSRIAVTIMDSDAEAALCPYFGKCYGIAIHDARTGAWEFHRNPARTPRSLCDLILRTGVDGLVCGFIASPEIHRLRAAGIDVRLGSGRCSAGELAACFCDLPEA